VKPLHSSVADSVGFGAFGKLLFVSHSRCPLATGVINGYSVGIHPDCVSGLLPEPGNRASVISRFADVPSLRIISPPADFICGS